MSFSRRRFMKWAAAASTLAVTPRAYTETIPLPWKVQEAGFRPALLPSQKEVWDNVTWMAQLGPKFTGNKAHTQFVEFLATQLQSLGLDLTRDHYTFPRWEAKRWEISVHPASGQPFNVPVTSYWPYSGQTPAEGVTGELVYGGVHPGYQLSGVEGKIVFVDIANEPGKLGRDVPTVGCSAARHCFPCAAFHASLAGQQTWCVSKSRGRSGDSGLDQRFRRKRGRPVQSLRSRLAEYSRAVCGPRERGQG